MTGRRESAPPDAYRSITRIVLDAPRPVRVLVLGVLLNRLGSFFVTFLVLFVRDEGLSHREIAAVLLLAGVATVLGSVVGGWAADRFSRKRSLVFSTLSAGASLLLVSLAPDRATLLIGVFAAALLTQAYIPAASALLIDHSHERDRVPTFALFRLALNVGAALGAVAAMLLVPHGLAVLFAVDGATFLLFSALLMVGLPADSREPAAARAATGSGATTQAVARGTTLPILVLLAAVLAITMVYAQYTSTLPLHVLDVGQTASMYAALLTVNGALVIVGELPLTAITRSMPWRVPIAAGIVLMGAGIAVSGVSPSIELMLLGVVVWTFGEMLYSPVVNTAVAALSSPERVGRYQGYLAGVQAIGFSTGPALGTLLYAESSNALWIACGAVGALAATSLLLVRERSREPAAGTLANAI